jgi:hypothetical protein
MDTSLDESLITDICYACGYSKKNADKHKNDSFFIGFLIGVTTTSLVITLGIIFNT